jgi:Mor family transcriptional regulator
VAKAGERKAVERDMEIYRRRLSGEKLSALGLEFNLSPQRILMVFQKQLRYEKEERTKDQ